MPLSVHIAPGSATEHAARLPVDAPETVSVVTYGAWHAHDGGADATGHLESVETHTCEDGDRSGTSDDAHVALMLHVVPGTGPEQPAPSK